MGEVTGEPVGNTCPMIDKVSAAVQSAIKELNDCDTCSMSPNDWQSVIESAESELSGVAGIMEDIRSANSALRDWGSEVESDMEELQKEHEAEVDRLNMEIAV